MSVLFEIVVAGGWRTGVVVTLSVVTAVLAVVPHTRAQGTPCAILTLIVGIVFSIDLIASGALATLRHPGPGGFEVGLVASAVDGFGPITAALLGVAIFTILVMFTRMKPKSI